MEMLKCKFKEDVEVKGYTIKKGTKGRIINSNTSPNCYLTANVYVESYDVNGLDIYTIRDNKEYSLNGLVISTKTKNILFYADYNYQKRENLYGWQVERILGFIPDTFKSKYGKYKLGDVIDYLDDELSEWVAKEGVFEEITEDMIDSGDISSEFEVGDNMLVNVDEFYEQASLLNKKLECVGFYYNFSGGLRLFD